MWRNWHRKGLLLAAGFLVVAFAGGVVSHTAYAKFKGNTLSVDEFHTSFGGVSAPFSELENGKFDVELFGERFIRDKHPQMTITLLKNGNMVFVTDQTVCDDGAVKGWCINSEGESWAYHPQFFNPAIPVDSDTTIVWGPGTIEKLGSSKNGMAGYMVKIDVPANAEDGVQVVVDLEGFVSKMKEYGGGEEGGDDDYVLGVGYQVSGIHVAR